MDAGSIRDPSEACLKLANIPYLQNLRILSAKDRAVYDAMLQLIADHMPQLEELNIQSLDVFPAFTYEGVDPVVKQCEKLKFLIVGFQHR